MQLENLMTLAAYPAGGKGYVASRDVAVGAVVAEFSLRNHQSTPSKYTIQVARDRHVDADEVRFLNHSCVPTTFVDTAVGQVVALRPIRAGEQLTFFYPATEWAMASPFRCACGNDGCLGMITGAVALEPRVLERYALNDHILLLAAERDRDAVPAPVAG